MDFGISRTADSGSQQIQGCQKYADETLVFFISTQSDTALMISVITCR